MELTTESAGLLAGVIAITGVAVKVIDRLVDAMLLRRNAPEVTPAVPPVYDQQAADARREILDELRGLNGKLDAWQREIRGWQWEIRRGFDKTTARVPPGRNGG